MKKYLTAAFLLVMTLFLCACGADVNSTVTVNPDESGERVMVMTISKNDLKMAGKFKLSDVDSAIADSCPDCMTYAYEEDGKTVRATFTLPFSSVTFSPFVLKVRQKTTLRVAAVILPKPPMPEA